MDYWPQLQRQVYMVGFNTRVGLNLSFKIKTNSFIDCPSFACAVGAVPTKVKMEWGGGLNCRSVKGSYIFY